MPARQGTARQPPPPPPAPPVQVKPAAEVAATGALVAPAHAPVVRDAPTLAPASVPRSAGASGDVELGQRPVAQVRVRSVWAPVRASANADALVLCSLARGTQLETHGQLPGNRGRWFEVACDTHKQGWVHENHVRARRL